MISIGIQCQIACPACGVAIPVNAVAPSLYCPGCSRVIRLSPQGLAELFKEALANPGGMQPGEGRSGQVWTPDGTFELGFVRMDPRCEHCKTPVDAEQAVAGGQGGWVQCAQCGGGVSVRETPADLGPAALPGVTHLIGEDFEQLAAGGVTSLATSQQAAPVPCGQCGGALQLDGTSRQVVCSYCGATVVVPDDVWARLHPANAARRWFALVAGGHPHAPPGAVGGQEEESWGRIQDAHADAAGNVYCLGRWGDGLALWAMDAVQLRTKWIQRGLDFEAPAHLALTGDGYLVVSSDKKSAGRVFSCADGTPQGEVGGQEPQGAQVHFLDFIDLASFCADPDGSFVAFFKERLLRFARSGQGVSTWPEAKGALSFLKGGQKTASLWTPCSSVPSDSLDKNDWDGPRQRLARPARTVLKFDWTDFSVKKVGNRPLAFGWNCHPKVSVGPDGCLYVMGEADHSSLHLLKFDRAGKRLYSAKLPIDDVDWNARPYGAADGSAYVLGEQNSEYKTVVRVTPDGRQAAEVARDKQLGGLLIDDDECLAVAPDGRFFVAGDDGSLIAFEGDGRVIAMTEAARRQRG